MNVLRDADGQRPAFASGLCAWALISLVTWQTKRVFDADYRVANLMAATAIAAIIATAVTLLIWQLRAAVYVFTTIALSSAVVVLTARPQPIDLFAAFKRAPLHGFSDLTAAVWPSPALGSGVAALSLLTLAAACLATDFGLRRRSGMALFLPLIIMAVVALLAADGGPPSAPILAAFVLIAMAMLRLQQPIRQSNVSLGFGVAMLVIVGIVPMVANAWTTSERLNPRDAVDGRSPNFGGINPLSRVELWRSESPRSVLFSSTLAQPQRWRLVALTSYNGREWLPANDYRVTGNIVGQPLDDVATDSFEVTIGSLQSPWLPSPDNVLRISEPVEADGGVTGLLLASGGDAAGGLTYAVSAQPQAVSPADSSATAASPTESPFADAFEPPVSLQRLAQSVVADATTDKERAELLATYLREGFVLDSTSTPGHSLAILSLFLETSQRGADEQFVGAYALLAASLGLPVRISVGFETSPDPTNPALGTVALSSSAVVWPEVRFADAGWVAFDPIPSEENLRPSAPEGGAGGPTELADPPPPVSAPAQSETAEADVPDPTPPLAAPPLPQQGRNVALIALLVFVSALLLAVIAYIVVVLAIKQRRLAQRNRIEDPRERVLAAFRSGIDIVVDLGGTAPRAATDRELVSNSSTVVAESSRTLVPVARTATAAVFAPDLIIDDGHADDSWQRIAEFQRQTSKLVGRRRSLRARLSTRSLRRGLPDS